MRKQTPSDFLKQIIGRPVVVKLNSGVDYRGKTPGVPGSAARFSFIVLSKCLLRNETLTKTLFLFAITYAGVLACLDGYMNIAIEQTEEYVNGQLKNKYGDAFLRGNNGKRLHFYNKNTD